MCRVEAEPRPSLRPRGQPVPERAQLLERAPERRARARRPLDQQADLPRDRRQALGIGAGVACEPVGPIVDVVPGVRYDPGDAERPATLQLARKAPILLARNASSGDARLIR